MEVVIKFAKMQRFFLDNPDEVTDSVILQGMGIDPEVDWNLDAGYWVSEARESVIAELAKLSFNWVVEDGKIVGAEFDTEDWEAIYEHQSNFCNRFAEEYDNIDEESTEMETSQWRRYGLGGDDDVDYNGGYLDAAFGLIAQYLECHEFNMELL